MANKSNELRRFYAILFTSPHLYSPVAVSVVNSYQRAEEIAQKTKEKLAKKTQVISTFQTHSFTSFEQMHPLIHIVPLDIPVSEMK